MKDNEPIQSGGIVCPSCHQFKPMEFGQPKGHANGWDKVLTGFTLLKYEVKKPKGILPEIKINSVAVWICDECNQKLQHALSQSGEKITLEFLTELAKKWSDVNDKK